MEVGKLLGAKKHFLLKASSFFDDNNIVWTW